MRITRARRAASGACLILLLLTAWTLPVLADPPKGWPFLPLDRALEQAQQEQKRVFLYFGRHGCPSCERTNRESFTDARVIERYQANYVLAYVDSEGSQRLRLPGGERITEMALGVRLKVFGTPFFYFMEPDGSAILRAPGYQSAEEFLRFDRFVDGGHYKTQSFTEFKAAGS